MEIVKKRILRKWEKLRVNLGIGYASKPELLSDCYEQIKSDLFAAYDQVWDGKERHEIEVYGFLSDCVCQAYKADNHKAGVYWMEIQDLLIRLDEANRLDKDDQSILI
jgi:hypothetical protein